ncbi:branched-chain amino acid ABC transporter permease [Hyalangium rubrum]|uniref:Branched-chain amino acid ABC transporter permease n=1 Tax=Hyalangium rubrum TaxID=3103134 RepID=A0ABU5H4D4_9BACT|nr:branched-chain amino acid ABC transporter permease [Hyalangium sp. s54d21]MDY7227668.1 branched-chain amino acid ABC transporter permease [Hyalangium sp. s54d21]
METSSVPAPVGGVPQALRGILPVLVALPVLLLLNWGMSGSPFATYLLSIIGVNVILAVSLNIVNGMTGQFSIGHAGFMAVGAYVAGVLSLTLKEVAISFLPVVVSDQIFLLLCLLVGGSAAALCGFLVGLPSLRLRGDYLAIVTLGFGEIIRVVVQNTDAFGRALGLSGIPQTSNLAMIGFWVFLVVLVARRIAGSSHGRSLWAIREDEVAAEAMGVNTTGYKVRAFVISAFFAGIAGGLFAHFVPIINPGSFTFVKSMEIVVMVVLGGLGSTTGAIVAAVFLTLLPEALRSAFTAMGAEGSLAQKVDQIRMPVYGLLLVALMLLRPQGLFGTREFWDVLPRWIARRRKGIQ